MARMIDGTFDFIGDAITVRAAPARTIAILTALQGALRAAQGGQKETEVVDELRKASPEFAAVAQTAISKGGLHTLIVLLVLLLANCSMKLDQTLDWNRLIDQAFQYLGGETPAGPERKEASQSEPEQPPKLSRQQRRQQERQSKKRH
jgi:plasmid stabilization system protein ParE